MVGGFFAILDDISMLMENTAAVSKVSIKNTVPLLGDDLAVNAEKASGYNASRELPVLWAITKGSFRNKLIILPIAFTLSVIAPWLISPILALGGLYLSYEGAEVIYHYLHSKIKKGEYVDNPKDNLTEKEKIKSAVLTDFVLSIEIIVVAIGTVMDQPFIIRIAVVFIIAVIATVGVYGIVALLVRMDDIGYYIIKKSKDNSLYERFGEILVASLPKAIKILSFVGTIAMLLVAGSLITHHLDIVHYFYSEHLKIVPLLIFNFLLPIFLGMPLYIFVNSVRTISSSKEQK